MKHRIYVQGNNNTIVYSDHTTQITGGELTEEELRAHIEDCQIALKVIESKKGNQ